MKAERNLAGRSTVALPRPSRAGDGIENASMEDVYGDQTDEFDVNFSLDDDGILDDADSDVSDWCDAQEVARELAGRAWC